MKCHDITAAWCGCITPLTGAWVGHLLPWWFYKWGLENVILSLAGSEGGLGSDWCLLTKNTDYC